MTTKTLKRSSMLLILSGALLVMGMLFHPGMSMPDSAASPAWGPVHIMLGFSALFGLAGLAGLFAVMNLNMRPFGRAAFGLAMLGNLLLTGILFFVHALVLPVLARDPAYQPLLTQNGLLETGALGTAVAVSMVIGAIGYLLLAWYLVNTRTITPVNGLLFIGAPLLVFAAGPAGLLGGLLLGGGLVWLGISIRSGIAHRSLATSLRVQDECLAHLGHA